MSKPKNIQKNIRAGGLCLAALLAASSTQASYLVTFNNSGLASGYDGTTTTSIGSQLTADTGTEPQVNMQNVPQDTGITTLDYDLPLVEPGTDHTQYGWVAYYNSTDTLQDLLHFDNDVEVGGTFYQSMFLYSGATLTALQAESTKYSSILAYTYLTSLTQNVSGSFPLYTPASTNNGGDILGSPTLGSPYEYQLSTPGSLGGVPTVPEPATLVAGVSLLLPFGASALKILRKKNTA
jgi:hypothetical protein